MSIALIALLTVPGAAYAHEKWFADAKAHPTHWEQLVSFPQIVGVSLALAATIVLALVWRKSGGHALLPGPEALGASPDGRARFLRIPVKWATDSGGCGPGSEEPAAGVKT